MKAGDRNRRIAIERPVVQFDLFGGEETTWEAIGTGWWASVYPLKDSEIFRNSEATATITHRFQIDWTQQVSSVIDPRCRIVYDGKVYNIVSVKENGRRLGIEISATARAENG